MKIQLFTTVLSLLSAMTLNAQDNKNDYLKKVLGNLEKIESAAYTAHEEAWEPGDTMAVYSTYFCVEEYNNPADTAIGASFLQLEPEFADRFNGGYDGEKNAIVYQDDKLIVIDDFTVRNLPFRLVSPPFYNYVKTIIKYALETSDNIAVTLDDLGDDYHFKLVISEDRQVEFFGKAYYIDNPYAFDPTSVYELWIRKSNDIPYKFRRELCHSISASTCLDAEFNKLSIRDFNLSHHFPADYEIRKYGERKNTSQQLDLLGAKAPDWTLKDVKEKEVSLAAIKSKVVLIEFTGIGCGPCMASIPFLNKLKKNFGSEDLEVVAIDIWKQNTHSGQNYVNRHNITYSFLCGTDAVVKDYQTGRGVPVFFILDRQREVRKIIKGYSVEVTDKEITDAIAELL